MQNLIEWQNQVKAGLLAGIYPKREFKFAEITTTAVTQSRLELDKATLDRYAEIWKIGGELPPGVVVNDGYETWLVDGYHRYHSKRSVNKNSAYAAYMITGTLEQAIFFSLGVNADHGLPRKDRDINYSVISLLKHGDWVKFSNVQIAEACGCGEFLVRAIKKELNAVDPKYPNAFADLSHKRGLPIADLAAARASLDSVDGVVTGKDGRTIDTKKIGKTKPEPEIKPQYFYLGRDFDRIFTGQQVEIKNISFNNPDNVMLEIDGNVIPVARTALLPIDSDDETIRQKLVESFALEDEEIVCKTETGELGCLVRQIPMFSNCVWTLKLEVRTGDDAKIERWNANDCSKYDCPTESLDLDSDARRKAERQEERLPPTPTTSKIDNLSLSPEEADRILIGWVRYCLGHKTYAVNECCTWLKSRWQEIPPKTLKTIQANIQIEIQKDDRMLDLGHKNEVTGEVSRVFIACDRRDWDDVLKTIGGLS